MLFESGSAKTDPGFVLTIDHSCKRIGRHPYLDRSLSIVQSFYFDEAVNLAFFNGSGLRDHHDLFRVDKNHGRAGLAMNLEEFHVK
jgi:hypothetical protein